MVSHRSALSLLCAALMGAASAAAQTVVINEIHYNPPGPDGTVLLEYVELHNPGVAAVDISGWELDFGTPPFVFPAASSISAGGYVVVAEDIASLDAATGHTAVFEFGGLGAGLSNDDDTVLLRDGPAGLSTVIDSVSYLTMSPWPIDVCVGGGTPGVPCNEDIECSGGVCMGPDGNGSSLELIHPSLNNAFPSSWLASTVTNGTPGAVNSVFTTAPTITAEVPQRFSAVDALPQVSVTFSEAVTGVTAGDLTVNGSAATAVSGSGAGPYVFSGYAAPAAGSTAIALASGSIAGGVAFGGDSWTISTGLVLVINEIHYEPADPNGNIEFLEIYNAGTNAADMSGWSISDGFPFTFPGSTTLNPGAYLVLSGDPAGLQTETGYAGALQWIGECTLAASNPGDPCTTDPQCPGGACDVTRLSNGGERLALSDTSGNELDDVQYDSTWSDLADGGGPSLELRNPNLPNQFEAAWGASLADFGTPGAQNSIFQASVAPIISGVVHSPPIPAANQAVTVVAAVVDDSGTPTVTLHHRQDQNPTIAYTATPMVDDGTGGDVTAGDGVFTAVVAGLADGQRMDFTIRATDGANTASAPTGNDTVMPGGGDNPAQTYLCKFDNASQTPALDMPTYHLIYTANTRATQVHGDTDTEFDATFLQCDLGGNCEIFYNVTERYRGRSSATQHPHSFRIRFSNDQPLHSEMGFDITRLNLMAQCPVRHVVGYDLFEAVGDPTPRNQLVRLNTSPLSEGGTQDFVYVNVERVDEDFASSQSGDISPERFPARCNGTGLTCEDDTQCPVGESCLTNDTGNIYRGRGNANFSWLGTDPNSYRNPPGQNNGYEKETNEDADEWDDLITLCDILNCSSSDTGSLCLEDNYNGSYINLVETGVNVEQWTRWFALHMVLNNNEGGLWRDTGDDYFVYFYPTTLAPVLISWDMDAIFANSEGGPNANIWRTRVDSVERLLRHNEFAGRFVGAVCDLLDNEFAIAPMHARLDALPDAGFPTQNCQGGGSTNRQGLKDWVTARHPGILNQISTTTTITGVPASPYTDPNPLISISGALNQCGTHTVVVNGLPTEFTVANPPDGPPLDPPGATWRRDHTLVPGVNNLVVQCLDHNGVEVDRVEASVTYLPPGGALRMTMPTRMVNTRTLSLRVEVLDQFGDIDWRSWTDLGTVTARRAVGGAPVPISITVFDNHISTPADSIRFYNGQGSVSITLDNGAAEPPGDVIITVARGLDSVEKTVTVLDDVPGLYRQLSGTLNGADLVWSKADGVINITGNCSVPSGQTLSIGDGTLVMVDTTGGTNNGTLITVSGNIESNGTAAEPVHFFSTEGPAAMVLQQNAASNPNSWRGIAHNGNGNSTYDYTFITGAGNGVVQGHPRPPILWFPGGNSHSLVFSDGMVCDGSGMAFSGNGVGSYTVLRSLMTRLGIGGEFNGNGHTLVLEDCWWTSTGWAPDPVDGDLIHVDGPASNQIIRGNVFADGGDDGVDHSGSHFRIENSMIWGILDKAISMTGGSIDMENCLLFDSGQGIRGGGTVVNSTIATGNPTIVTPTVVQESIIWPNSIDTCTGDIDYTIVGNAAHLGCGVGNFSSNPLFSDPNNCDYTLQPGSPAATAGPTGGRIGWLGFPDGDTCVADGDCDDDNGCTTDTCDLGACLFTPIGGCIPCDLDVDCDDGDPCTAGTCQIDGTCAFTPAGDGAPCTDGVACTTGDQCQSGVCVGTDSCPVGQSCNTTTEVCESLPTMVMFQNGFNSYTGTQDTFLQEDAPAAVNGALDNWEWDGQDGGSGTPNTGLIRFDNIIGNSPGQIPAGSTIASATLTLVVFDPSVAPAADINESLVDWDQASASWNTFGATPGIQPEDIGTLVGSGPLVNGVADIDVTASLQAWSDGAANFGWVFSPNATNGVQVRSSEYVTATSERPKLSVEFIITGCTVPADCNDGNMCTTDDCVSDTCSNTPIPGCCATALDCDDSNPCTDDSCVGNVCLNENNTDPCDDGDLCTQVDTCGGGTCNGSSPVDCSSFDDQCVVGQCNSATGTCQGAPTNEGGGCDDGVACTTGDVCTAGLCAGTSNCGPGESCNPGTGFCEVQTTFMFQEGINGYVGTHDTFLQEDVPTAINGALEAFEWDGEDGTSLTPNTALLRFANIFDGFGGPIPTTGTILSATLTYTIGGPDSPVGNGGQLHVIDPAVAWDQSTVNFDNFGGEPGIQLDEYDPAFEVAFGTPAGPIDLDVTAAVQAWQLAPADNRGWLVLAVDNDGVVLRSSEYVADPNERPKLSVTIAEPAQPCTLPSECDDNSVCNGLEDCVGGFCVSGTPLDCDDGDACTADSCDSVTGCANDVIDCDDGVACTDDSCDSGSGCQNVDNCPAGQVCNIGSGTCQIGTVGPGDVIIAGFQANGTPEWIELFNTTSQAISLEDLNLTSRTDTGAGDGTLDVDWDLVANETPVLTGLSIAPHSFFLVGETGAGADLEVNLDLATGEGGTAERAIGLELVIDGLHIDHVLYGRHDGSDSGANPPGDLPFDGSTFPRDEVIRTVTGALPIASFNEGATQRLTDVDLYAGFDVEGFYTDEDILGDGNPNGVWFSQHSTTGGTPRDSSTPPVLPPAGDADPPTIDAVGSRYLAVTPPPGESSVALLVESPDLPCVSLYVDASGLLVAAPVFQSSAAWGTVFVGDEEIQPTTTYDVYADVRDSGDPENLSTAVQATTWAWGDGDNADGVTITDIVCALDGFRDVFNVCTLHGVDLLGAVEQFVPDRNIDIVDIVGFLDAFAGDPYADGDPCNPQPDPPAQPTSGATLVIVPQAKFVEPGGTIDLDVFVRHVEDLRGYQISLTTAGSASVSTLAIDTDRSDYVFLGLEDFPVVADASKRLASALLQGGVDAGKTPLYLGTVTLKAERNARGFITVAPSQAGTLLVDSNGQPMDTKAAARVRVRIAN